MSRRLRLSLVICVVTVVAGNTIAQGPSASLANSKLVKVLAGNDPIRRAQAIATLRQKPDHAEALLEPLISLAKLLATKNGHLQVASPVMFDLVHLIASIDRPEAEAFVIELMDSPHIGISMLAIDAVGTHKLVNAIDKLIDLEQRDEFETSYGFRFNLVRSLASMQDSRAIEHIDKMRLRLDGQLRYEIEKLLKNVDAASFDNDEESFHAWKSSRQPKIQLTSGTDESEYDDRMRLGP